MTHTEYRAIHTWIQKNYGRAKSCSNNSCSGKSKSFQWALLKGKSHARDISNYTSLCSSCHLKYDYTEQRKINLSNSLIGKKLKFNKRQENVIKAAYLNGTSLPELCQVFNCYPACIIRFTKHTRPIGLSKRKYNERQINVMKSASQFGTSYSDLSRVFSGNDKERAGIYRIVNNQLYV